MEQCSASGSVWSERKDYWTSTSPILRTGTAGCGASPSPTGAFREAQNQRRPPSRSDYDVLWSGSRGICTVERVLACGRVCGAGGELQHMSVVGSRNDSTHIKHAGTQTVATGTIVCTTSRRRPIGGVHGRCVGRVSSSL